MEARNRSLSDWLTRIRTRQLVLPRFQRFEAWSFNQKNSLLNTILQELPAGALLILEIGDIEPFHSRPVNGAPEVGEKINEHLLDGQQRLTTLWKALNDLYDDRTFFVKNERDEELDLPYHIKSFGRYYRNGNKYPLWCDDPKELWERQLIPVHLLRPDSKAEQEFQEWSKLATDNNFDDRLQLLNLGNQLRNKFSKFNIPFLSLPLTTKPEIALNVFIQMNTSSTPLTSFDIVVAQIEAATGNSLHHYIDELKNEAINITRFNDTEGTVLAIAALLNNTIPSQGTYLDKGFSRALEANWKKIKQGLKKCVSFLSEEKIYSSKILPSNVVVYVIAAVWAEFDGGLDKEGQIRSIIRKYMWRAFFTERYDRLTNSRAFQDYKDILSLISDKTVTPVIFNNDFYPVATTEDFMTSGWPTKRERLARAILVVSLKAGGFDFADGAPATFENLQSREYHHIFPDAWLKAKSYQDYEINRALNCSLISWKTNRHISDKSPSEYVADRMEATHIESEEVSRRLNSHLIPLEALENNDYTNFLEIRASLVKKMVDKLCEGQIIEGLL
jgi:hypothetical protein